MNKEHGGSKALVVVLAACGGCLVLTVLVVVGLLATGVLATLKSPKEIGRMVLEKQLESKLGNDVDLNFGQGNTFEISTGEGTISTSDKLPSGFPTDVPIYPNSTIVGSMTSKENQSYSVMLNTTDPINTAAVYYQNQLPTSGWTAEDTTTSWGSGSVISATKGDRVLTVVVGEADGGKSLITLSVSTQPSGE